MAHEVVYLEQGEKKTMKASIEERIRSWCRREKRNSWRSRDNLGLEGRKELSREEMQDQALLTARNV